MDDKINRLINDSQESFYVMYGQNFLSGCLQVVLNTVRHISPPMGETKRVGLIVEDRETKRNVFMQGLLIGGGGGPASVPVSPPPRRPAVCRCSALTPEVSEEERSSEPR